MVSKTQELTEGHEDNPVTFAGLLSLLKYELALNAGRPKSRLIIAALRSTQYLRTKRRVVPVIYSLAAGAYKLLTEWLLGAEIPPSTPIGRGLRIEHGVGIVINPNAVIGRDVLIRHAVTIGNRVSDHDCPKVGDRVSLGAGAIVLGAIEVGADSRIGAGALVVKSVPAGSSVRSVAAEIIPPRGI